MNQEPQELEEGKPQVGVLPPLLVSAKGLAAMLSCSARHIQTLDASGAIPVPIRLGRRTLWSVEIIRQWCAAGCPTRDKWMEQK